MDLRIARPNDLGAVDALLARSYPALLKADYSPSVLVTALPIISRANPSLMRSGTYWLAEEGRLLGAGGWTAAPPVAGQGGRGIAHVRHVVTDPSALRRGVARSVLSSSMTQAAAAGFRAITALSTRTAVPFYAALGFERIEEMEVPLRPGIVFPAVRMTRRL
jgi:GNAT superfamily N-acetyltransferase